MPLIKTTKDGKTDCYKYGDSGKVYCGPGAKKKAIKQGLAESYRSGEKFEPGKGDIQKASATISALAFLSTLEEKGYDIVSIHFDKNSFTKSSAIKWAENFVLGVDMEEDSCYISGEQMSLAEFKESSIQVVPIMQGISVVVGIIK